MLRQAGNYYVVGYGENISVPTIDMVSDEINIIGNLVGSYNDLSDLMALAARGLSPCIPRSTPSTTSSRRSTTWTPARSAAARSCSPEEGPLIFITAKFPVKPEHADDWPSLSRSFTEATRSEEGCLWFEWSRSLDDPNVYVLVEAFRDDDAGGAHVRSEHFATATSELPAYLQRTPDIVNCTVPGESWSELGEMAVR